MKYLKMIFFSFSFYLYLIVPHSYTLIVFLVKPLPNLLVGIEWDAAGVLAEVQHPPVMVQSDEVLGVEHWLLAQSSYTDDTYLAIQSAQRTVQDGVEFIFQWGLLIVDVIVRLAGDWHLGLHHQTVVPLPVSVRPVNSPGQVLERGGGDDQLVQWVHNEYTMSTQWVQHDYTMSKMSTQ